MNGFGELVASSLLRGTWLMVGSLIVVLLLRRRTPLVASALLSGTILGLAALPVLIAGIPTLRVPVMSSTPVMDAPEALRVRQSPPENPRRASNPELSGAGLEMAAPMRTDAVPQMDGASVAVQRQEMTETPLEASVQTGSARFSWTTLLFGIYAAGALFFAARLPIGFLLLRRLRRMTQPVNADWQDLLAQCCGQLGVLIDVGLFTTGGITVPMTIGWRRPVILLPTGVLHAPAGHRQAILLHELAHIRRQDFLWLLLLRLVQAVYWCHPLAWVLGRVDRQLREQACDDVCVHWMGNGTCYRDALLSVAGRIARRPRLTIGLAMAARSSLSRRVAHILRSPGREQCVAGRSARLSVAAWLLLAAPVTALVQFVPRTSAAQEADARPADTQTGPNQAMTRSDREERSAPTTQLIVTDADGEPVARGEADVSGYTTIGEYFEAKLAIERGAVTVPIRSTRVDSITIVVGAPGCLTHYRKFVRRPDESAYVVPPEYTFALQRGQRIGGRLVNEQGEPVGGAEVYLYVPSGGVIEEGFDGFERTVTSDADGRWETDRAPASLKNFTMQIRHEHYVARGPEVGGYEALRDLSDVRTLAAAPTLSGTVVDPDGNPVAGAMMLFSGSDNLFVDLRDGRIPRTNDKGEFHFSNVPLGEHRLTAFSPDWALATLPVTVPAAEPIKFTVHKGQRIEFRAVDTEGHPIAGVQFHPEGRCLDFLSHRYLLGNRTNDEGVFVWENAPDDMLSYQIYGPRHLAIHDVKFGPEGSPHTLVFRRRLPVELTVLDAATGREVTEYKLYQGSHFKSNRPGLWSWHLRTRQQMRPVPGSAAEGDETAGRAELELANLDRLVQYRIQADGYRPAASPVLDAAALPDEPVQVEIRLEKNTGYDGRVVRPDGTIAAAANVYVKIKVVGEYEGLSVRNGTVQASTASDVIPCGAEGRFHLPPLNDPFVCFISDESGYRELTDAALLASETVTLLPWATVSGEVRLNGDRAADLSVSITSGTSDPDSGFPGVHYSSFAQTDESGAYSFPHCAAGHQSLSVHYDDVPVFGGYGGERRHFDLEPGVEAVQDFGRGTADVIGRIVLPDPDDVDRWRSGVSYSEAEELSADFNGVPVRIFTSHQTGIQESGEFRIHNIPGAGKVGIWIWIQGETAGWSHMKEIPITPEMFEGKSSTDPIELGEIRIEPDVG